MRVLFLLFCGVITTFAVDSVDKAVAHSDRNGVSYTEKQELIQTTGTVDIYSAQGRLIKTIENSSIYNVYTAGISRGTYVARVRNSAASVRFIVE